MDYQLDYFMGSKLKLRCPTHPRDFVTHVCHSPKCLNRCFFYCNSCTREELTNDHAPHLLSLESSIIKMSEDIEKLTTSNQSTFENMFQSNSEYSNLIKWQTDYKEHLKRVEDHLVAQKMQIAEDIANLIANLSEFCQRAKNDLMGRIDNYFLRYRTSFDLLRKNVDQGFALSRVHKYYSNPNNLSAKLQTELPSNLNNYLQSLKEAIAKAAEIAEGKSETLLNIRRVAKDLNFMADNLPLYRAQESLENLQMALEEKIGNYLSSNLDLKEDISESKIIAPNVWRTDLGGDNGSSKHQRLFSPDNTGVLSPKDSSRDTKGIVTASRSRYKAEKIFESRLESKRTSPFLQEAEPTVERIVPHNISNDFRNLLLHSQTQQFFTELTFKQSQKMQVGFPVSCLSPISSESVILANAKDFCLYVFSLKGKKCVETLNGHTDLITSLTSVQTFEKFMQGSFSNIKNVTGNLKNESNKEEGARNLQTPGSQSILISTSADKNVILWSVQGSSLKYYQKLVGFLSPVKTVLDLQDYTTIITGDGVGEIIVWDYHKAKILFVFRGQHSTGITAATILKTRESFAICSRDGVISLWRVKYTSKLSHSPENCTCEKLISEKTGGILKCIAPYYENQEKVALFCADGFIRLFDLAQQCTIYELGINFDKDDEASVELLNISEKIENSQTFVLISFTKENPGFKTLVGGENGSILKVNNYEFPGEGQIGEGVRKKGAFLNMNKTYPSLLILGESTGSIEIFDIFFEKR